MSAKSAQKSVKETNNKVLKTKNGDIEYNRDDIYMFPQGIVGYEVWKKYLLLPVPGLPEDSPYMMLQSIENKDLSFIMMQIVVEDHDDYDEEPIIYYKDLKPYFDDKDMKLSETAVLLVISIESTIPDTQEVSANLAGPILMNPNSRTGRQIILEDERYDTKKIIKTNQVNSDK